MMRVAAVALGMALAMGAQSVGDRWPRSSRGRTPSEEDSGVRLPSGKKQSEEILKAEHEKSLEEISRLLKLAEDLQDELVKNDRHVLSISAIKKAEEIEKLARRIKDRIRK